MLLPTLGLAAALAGSVSAIGCPYMGAELDARDVPAGHPNLQPRADAQKTDEFMSQFEINDTDVYLTSDVGGPFSDQNSLSAGERGPTLLEDFIFRQKIQHFDHERVPERAVHARGAGAHGVFTSYADWSNITGASFLAKEGKETPVFLRFSTVAGSRGSADTARDVHGFAVRLYTDEGNFGTPLQSYLHFLHFINSLKRHCRQQHPCLLHPGRYPLPGSDPRRQAFA